MAIMSYFSSLKVQQLQLTIQFTYSYNIYHPSATLQDVFCSFHICVYFACRFYRNRTNFKFSYSKVFPYIHHKFHMARRQDRICIGLCNPHYVNCQINYYYTNLTVYFAQITFQQDLRFFCFPLIHFRNKFKIN